MFGFHILKSVEGVNVPAIEEGITIQINDTIQKDLIGNWRNSTTLLCSHWKNCSVENTTRISKAASSPIR